MSAAQSGPRNHNWGIPLSADTKKKLSIAKTGKPGRRGFHHTNESKLALRMAQLGKPMPPKAVQSMRAKLTGRPKSEAHRQSISKALRGNKYGLGHKVSEAHKDILRHVAWSRRGPFFNTKPEITFQNLLRSRNVDFVTHAEITGLRLADGSRHLFDVLIPHRKLAIEIQGCYWHGCKKCFRSLKAKQIARADRDRSIARAALSLGWKVAEVWQHNLSK